MRQFHRLSRANSRATIAHFLLAIFALATSTRALDPFPGDVNGVHIAANFPSGLEPSDAVWHPRLERLFVVDDGGWLIGVDESGTDVSSWWIGGDLEGVCVADPHSDLIYVADEATNDILEFSLVTGSVMRVFDLSNFLSNPVNQGIEALTFVPIEDHLEGGLFYVGHQVDGKIYVVELPVRSNPGNQTALVATYESPTGYSDLSALSYDAGTNVIYAAWDYADVLAALTTDCRLIHAWALPDEHQEGIASIGCRIFIAEDLGPVWMHSFWAIQGDADNDGTSDCDDLCPNTPEGAPVDRNGCPDFECPLPRLPSLEIAERWD